MREFFSSADAGRLACNAVLQVSGQPRALRGDAPAGAA